MESSTISPTEENPSTYPKTLTKTLSAEVTTPQPVPIDIGSPVSQDCLSATCPAVSLSSLACIPSSEALSSQDTACSIASATTATTITPPPSPPMQTRQTEDNARADNDEETGHSPLSPPNRTCTLSTGPTEQLSMEIQPTQPTQSSLEQPLTEQDSTEQTKQQSSEEQSPTMQQSTEDEQPCREQSSEEALEQGPDTSRNSSLHPVQSSLLTPSLDASKLLSPPPQSLSSVSLSAHGAAAGGVSVPSSPGTMSLGSTLSSQPHRDTSTKGSSSSSTTSKKKRKKNKNQSVFESQPLSSTAHASSSASSLQVSSSKALYESTPTPTQPSVVRSCDPIPHPTSPVPSVFESQKSSHSPADFASDKPPPVLPSGPTVFESQRCARSSATVRADDPLPPPKPNAPTVFESQQQALSTADFRADSLEGGRRKDAKLDSDTSTKTTQSVFESTPAPLSKGVVSYRDNSFEKREPGVGLEEKDGGGMGTRETKTVFENVPVSECKADFSATKAVEIQKAGGSVKTVFESTPLERSDTIKCSTNIDKITTGRSSAPTVFESQPRESKASTSWRSLEAPASRQIATVFESEPVASSASVAWNASTEQKKNKQQPTVFESLPSVRLRLSSTCL
eukprot:GHVQ01020622.1.p1 GENE.GHVQ01020622.1~~GHVQ01020622.1.p1  ORF type:complete len:624 (+),score=150.22 GHVQ01020622.1:292-2163(+)